MEGQSKGQSKQSSRQALMIGIIGLVLIIACVLGYLALRKIQHSKAVPIAEILADLRSYDGELVHVKGQVSNPTNLLYKWFELTDDSGTIIVVTERGLPAEGSEVTVDGTVNEVFKLGPLSKTVIMELPERE